MPKILLTICVVSIILFACAGTTELVPASKITFITATIGLPETHPTAQGSSATLTPLAEQVYAMTQDAKMAPYLLTPAATTYNTPTELPNTETATPQSTPTATIIPTIACRPEYPDFCIPYGHRKTCKEWNDLGYANFTVHKPDSLNYDKHAEGIGCKQ